VRLDGLETGNCIGRMISLTEMNMLERAAILGEAESPKDFMLVRLANGASL